MSLRIPTRTRTRSGMMQQEHKGMLEDTEEDFEDLKEEEV